MADYDAEPVGAAETASSMERTSQGIVRRWMSELDMADRAEKDWRTEAQDIWRKYEAHKTRANAFNILWSNTDTLLPAVFNSLPVPDVRRRFRDADPVGKAASEIIERTQSYDLDQYDAWKIATDATLDMLLPGRGIVRVRYLPLMSGDKVLDETVQWEHVQWDDFRHGPGKRWDDVRWVAFRHEMSRDTVTETFGPEWAEKLTYADAESADELERKDQRELFQTTVLWEIWDKDQRRTLFVAPCYKEAPVSAQDDPLGLTGFFPVPRPAYAVSQSRSLTPVPLYRLYKEQARELDRVSSRINKIVEALKVRGAYAASQTELGQVIEASDNQMVPIENLSGLADMGGLDKAIWIMPIDKLERVLQALYISREQIKQTIYEITGISDIIRGSTSASETATAQKLKSEWGTMRLQKMQKEVQRLLRDAMRLQAEIYSQRYDMQRFSAITGIQLPTAEQKAQMQAMMQRAAQQAQMTGQPPPQPPREMQEMLRKPTWEDVIQLLRTDGLRQYRIDIETDSTVKEVLQSDMMGLAEVTEAIGQLMAGAAPAIQAGMLPVEVPKEIALAIARRARLGTAVEDALDSIEAPPVGMSDPKQQLQELFDNFVATQSQKVAKDQMAQQQQQAGLQQYDAAIQQTLGQVAQVGQGAAVGLQQITEQQAQQQQVLAALVQAVQEMSSQDQGTRGQVQQTMGAAVEQFTAAAQAVLSGVQNMTATMQSVVEAVSKPKQVTFERDSKTNRIVGATATLQ